MPDGSSDRGMTADDLWPSEGNAEWLRVSRKGAEMEYLGLEALATNPERLGMLLAEIAKVATKDRPAELDAILDGFGRVVLAGSKPLSENFPKMVSYTEVVNMFHDETDRAAGLLAAGWLDNYFGECLRYFLVAGKEAEKLVGSERELEKPLSAFGLRARTMFVLGLLSQGGHQDVRLIIKIRNHFAHLPAKTSFENADVRSWCSSLSTSAIAKEWKEEQLSVVLDNPRDTYLFAISLIVGQVHNTMLLTQPRKLLK